VKPFVLVLAVAIFASISASYAEEAEDQPVSIKGFSRAEEEIFLRGVGYGLAVLDTTLQVDGKERVFCTPLEFDFGPKALHELANGVLAGPHGENVVALAILDQLTEKFPCKRISPPPR
jgi:hypothetical protein